MRWLRSFKSLFFLFIAFVFVFSLGEVGYTTEYSKKFGIEVNYWMSNYTIPLNTTIEAILPDKVEDDATVRQVCGVNIPWMVTAEYRNIKLPFVNRYLHIPIPGSSEKINFINNGKIVAFGQVGNAIKEDAVIEDIYGVGGFSDLWKSATEITAGLLEELIEYTKFWGKKAIQEIIPQIRTVDLFYNLGEISANTIAGDATGQQKPGVIVKINGVGGVILEKVGNFINNGTIDATAVVGNAIGSNSVVEIINVGGVVVTKEVKKFSNYKNINVNVSAGDAIGQASYVSNVKGVDLEGVFSGNINNFGTIAVNVKSGKNSKVTEVEGLSLTRGGIYINNTGNILVSVDAGEGSTVKDVAGLSYLSIAPMDNFGTIAVNVKSGKNSKVIKVEGLSLMHPRVPPSINNTGNILVSVDAGEGSTVKDVAGLSYLSICPRSSIILSDRTINNTGKISVSVNAGAGSTVDRVAGIYIANSKDVFLSNSGIVEVSILGNPKEVKNVRTLWVENSYVTLKDKFSIVFGAPGIDPNRRDHRPIYVSPGSTLNLNGVDLVARIDSRNLKFNTNYYLIDNKGTVNGTFGDLEQPTNLEVIANWAGKDRGANAAVSFSHKLGQQTKTIGTSYSTSAKTSSKLTSWSGLYSLFGEMPTKTSTSSVIGSKGWFLPESSSYFLEIPSLEIPFSSANLTSNKYIFLMPLSTMISAENLGFDANAYGFAFGIGGEFAKNLTANLYSGYTNVNLDYDITGLDGENQGLYIGGLSMTYAPKPWFARFLVNYHKAHHDYYGKTGLDYELYEKANYDSWGFDLEVTGGYVFGNEKFSFAPEIGLGYVYYDAEKFHTKVKDAPQWNRYYEPHSVKFVKGILGFYGIARFDNWTLYGSARVEQALSKNDVLVTYHFQDLPRDKFEQNISDTTIVGQLGLIFKLTDRWTLNLNGEGEFNSDYSDYLGQAVLNFRF